MGLSGAYFIQRNTRQLRTPLRTAVPVEIDFALPEDVQFNLYNINLGGVGIAIPVHIDPTLSKEENIRRNTLRLDIQAGQELDLFIPESDTFKQDVRVACTVRFTTVAQKMYNVTCLYYLGMSYKGLSNSAFTTIESVLART